MSFEERAESMDLVNLGAGCFLYSDRYGEVIYRKLITMKGPGYDLLDDFELPYLALFIKKEGSDQFRFVGLLSDLYKFVGNDILNQQIRDSISETRNPILIERPFFSGNLAQMHNEIIIQHPSNVPQIGDIYPMLIVRNSYNGTRKAIVEFGICMSETNYLPRQGDLSGNPNDWNWTGFGFRTKLGTISQVHIESSRAEVSAAVGNYISVFSQNIVSLIEDNFNSSLPEDDVLRILDLIEEVGKKRRERVSVMLEELTNQSPVTSNWNMFLAITRFSSSERNLNAKVLLEDIAERVLIVPNQMVAFL